MKTLQNKNIKPFFHVPSVNQLVINWHLASACNYRCRYCYSAWDGLQGTKEIIDDSGKTETLVKELARFFSPLNASNPLRGIMKWDTVRLNLAGGEPMLYPETTLDILETSRRKGLDVSMITNGSRLDHPKSNLILNHLSMIGISLDSSSPEKNGVIGRKDSRGRTLDMNGLISAVTQAKNKKPRLVVKMNTVVNQINKNEDFSILINTLKPQKWKILRMLPILTDDLAVSETEFNVFVMRNLKHKEIFSVEDNNRMTGSYLMVDPFGRFFQNHQKSKTIQPYIYSQPILEVGAEIAFSQIYFDAERFVSRYTNPGLSREV